MQCDICNNTFVSGIYEYQFQRDEQNMNEK